MNTLTSKHGNDETACPLPGAGRRLLDRLPGRTTFNATAIRARAGLVSLLLGTALAAQLANPQSYAVLYLSAYLLFDMLMAVSFGLRPPCPTGTVASLLASKMKVVPTPHLPKRFAWSMGASLALVVLTLVLAEADAIWVSLTLAVYLTLSWLDAALGFCMGCWIYSRLFDCETCRLD